MERGTIFYMLPRNTETMNLLTILTFTAVEEWPDAKQEAAHAASAVKSGRYVSPLPCFLPSQEKTLSVVAERLIRW
jgi:hypothetical protein